MSARFPYSVLCSFDLTRWQYLATWCTHIDENTGKIFSIISPTKKGSVGSTTPESFSSAWMMLLAEWLDLPIGKGRELTYLRRESSQILVRFQSLHLSWILNQRHSSGHPENPLNISFLQKASSFENRAADLTKLSIWKDCFGLISHFWSGPRQENWSLDLLAVHPDYEGKGHGRRLVQWGIDESKKEGIATSVVAAYEKDPFYERLGFVKVGMAK